MPRNESQKAVLRDPHPYHTEMSKRRQGKSPLTNVDEVSFLSGTIPFRRDETPSDSYTDTVQTNDGTSLSKSSRSPQNFSHWGQLSSTQSSSAFQHDLIPHALAQVPLPSEQLHGPSFADWPPTLTEDPTGSGGSMFHSASNTAIYGGQFTTQQWHSPQTVHFNYNFHNPTGFMANGLYATSSLANSSVNASATPKTKPSSTKRQDLPGSGRSNTTYENHLSLKGRGHPVWIPEPNLSLPDLYRERGISIGDVGIITPDGGFDFLFNICLPAESPINEGELPRNFEPINPPLNKRDIREFREFQRGSHLGSYVRVQGDGNMFESGLTFEPTSTEGAILAMPEGAFLQELNNVSLFRQYIAGHAMSWYEFANGPRGREAKNGDLRVIVGCDKTTCWGMGTFADVSLPTDLRLHFTASRAQAGHISGTYCWKYEGVADVKVGPDDSDSPQLAPAETSQLPRNQCLFIRTLSVTLGKDSWRTVRRKNPPNLYLRRFQEGPSSDINLHHLLEEVRSARSSAPPSWRKIPMAYKSPPFPRKQGQLPGRPEALSRLFGTRSWDNFADVPSIREIPQILKKNLLVLFPSAKTVIINDRDWQSAIMLLQAQTFDDDRDNRFFDRNIFQEELMDAVRHLNHPRYDEALDVAYFEPKDNGDREIAADVLVQDFRTGRETVERYLFDSTGPVSQNDRAEFINGVIDKLVAADVKSLSQAGDLFFLEGHKIRTSSLEFDIIPRLIHENTLLTRSTDDLRNGLSQPTSYPSTMDADRAADIRRLAHALYAQFLTGRQQEDLDEAIWWFREAIELTPKGHYLYLETVITLCCSLYFRWQLLGLEDDRESLKDVLKLEREIDVESLVQTVNNLVYPFLKISGDQA